MNDWRIVKCAVERNPGHTIGFNQSTVD